MAADPAAGTIYVTNGGSNTVSVIKGGHAVTATIPVGAGSSGVAVDPAAGIVYVTNEDDNTVSMIKAATGTVTATIPVSDPNSPRSGWRRTPPPGPST